MNPESAENTMSAVCDWPETIPSRDGMPYKDLEGKREWERQHRSQRIARRRELRRIEAVHNPAQPVTPKIEGSGTGVLGLPVVGGAAS